MKDTPNLHIKNMVCSRCVLAVQKVLEDLQIETEKVELGEVTLKKALDSETQQLLEERLRELGFDLLGPGKSQIISEIKTLIIKLIHHTQEPMQFNFSEVISKQLNHEYSYLSRLFSNVEGITIEKYITRQKIEKVKELLFYNEMTLSEIAYELDYSSVAHLSAQFKKETGMTPTEFKKIHKPGHRQLDSI